MSLRYTHSVVLLLSTAAIIDIASNINAMMHLVQIDNNPRSMHMLCWQCAAQQ